VVAKKYYFFFILGFFHLVLVGFGAAKFSFWDYGRMGQVIERYGLYTGSSRAFDFFAPGVGPSMRAQFDLYNRDGKLLGSDIIQESSNRECYLRVSNIVDIMGRRVDDPVIRKIMGASWAAKVLGRHPEASRVLIRMEHYDIPSMQEYAAGMRWGWEPLYQVHFEKKRKASHAKAE